MPINSRPLIEYWLNILTRSGIKKVFINVCFQKDLILEFLNHNTFDLEIDILHEENLLGTAGTIAKFRNLFCEDLLVIHCDNYGLFDLKDFLDFHHENLDAGLLKLVAFRTHYPKSCGIIEVDKHQRVSSFEEKPRNPQSNIANAAIYIFTKKVLDSIEKFLWKDISTEVLKEFIIGSPIWMFEGNYLDIGDELLWDKSQSIDYPYLLSPEGQWHKIVYPEYLKRLYKLKK